MERIVINGGRKLGGKIRVSGAKNAAFLAAEILAVTDEGLAEKLAAQRAKNAADILEKDKNINTEL